MIAAAGDLSAALSVSCAEYEATIPAKFMIGTDQGVVLGCSRKAKCQAEYILNKSVWYHWSHLMIRLQVWGSLWTNQSTAEKPKLHQELPHHWRLERQGLVWGHQWKLSSCCQLRNWGCDFYLSEGHSSKWSQCLKFNFVDNSFSPFSPQRSTGCPKKNTLMFNLHFLSS